MSQQVHASLQEELRLVSTTHFRQLTTTCSSSSRRDQMPLASADAWIHISIVPSPPPHTHTTKINIWSD